MDMGHFPEVNVMLDDKLFISHFIDIVSWFNTDWVIA